MRIDRNKLEVVKSLVRISDVYSFFRKDELVKIGGNYVTTCPFCGKEKHLYLYDNQDRQKPGVFQCYVCQEKGDVIKIISKLKGLGLGASIFWFLHEYLKMDSVEIMHENAAEPFTTENLAKYMNKSVLLGQTKKQKPDDYGAELLKLIGEYIESDADFLERLRQYVEERCGVPEILIDGWRVGRYQQSGHYYWRAVKKIAGGLHRVYLGKAFDLRDFDKKIVAYLKKNGLENLNEKKKK